MSNNHTQLSLVHSITALHDLGCTPLQIVHLMNTAKQLARLHERLCYELTEKQEAATQTKITKLVRNVEDMLKGLPVVIYRQSDPRGLPLYIISKALTQESVSVDAIYDKGIGVHYE